MILVSLGTQDKSFVRLLKMLEEALVSCHITDKVVVQAGFTKYQSERMQVIDYLDMKQFEELLGKCDLLLCHGGVGTMLSAMKLNKKIIASPRLAQFHEHHNDHQREVINSFKEKGYILACENVEELVQCLNEIKDFNPTTFESNHQVFLDLIRKEINKN